MPIPENKNLVIVTLITLCVLAAGLRLAGVTSHAAMPLLLDGNARATKPILSSPRDESARRRTNDEYGNLPLSFEANQGQADGQVKFISRGSGYNLYLTADEAVLALHSNHEAELSNDKASKAHATDDVLRMKLVGSNPTPMIEGSEELPGKSNYFIGNNPKNWRTNVSTFARVNYRDVYPGVDVVYYGNQRKLENDFVVAPGASPKSIALGFQGANKISIAADGNLVLNLSSEAGEVSLQNPVIYQIVDGVRREVAGNYVMRNDREVGFEVAAYDVTKPLVIDPVLVYSTYIGGNFADEGDAIAVDDSGNAYVSGTTASTIFPGAAPPEHGFNDVFVVKFNAAGSALLYSTYLGGSGFEEGFDIAVDLGGNAYVTGKTTSSDFPVVNAFKAAYSGGTDEDAFVTRINAAGSALVYSTYLAGSFGARGWSIAAPGSQGFAYVTGTTSVNFPVTASAFEGTNFNSGFMAKLCTNCSGTSSLVYSTFLAHTGSAEGRAIAADLAGNVYLTGNLNSTTTNFATAGAAQTAFGGGSADAYVEKFNTNLSGASSRVYATYLGGNAKDIGGTDGAGNPGHAIAIDDLGNAYITGATSSPNFPLVNAAQGTPGGQNDAFLTKLNPTGSSFIYSTYLGGTGDDFGRSVAVNIAGGATVTGIAGGAFPTQSPLPTPLASVGFVTKYNPSGNTVVYSTLLSGVSGGSFGIALDLAGNAFATGNTNASIVTFLPFQATNGGGGTDGWVTVIADPTVIGRVLDENGNPLAGATVNLTGVPSATTTTDANGAYTFGLLTAGNSYTVSVVATGYIFESSGVNNLVKNVRRDFGPDVNSIGGQVTLGSSGLSGVTMFLSGGKFLSVQTDVNGFYSFSNLPSGRNYTVTPFKFAFSFTPSSQNFNNLVVNQTFNFVATAIPIVSFSSSTYSIGEGAGALSLTVNRTNDTSGVSTVELLTAVSPSNPCTVFNGTALINCDFDFGASSATFNPGETTKTLTMLINDDAYVEGNETFTVELISPSGAVVGQGQGAATVTIIDNDTVAPTTNPLDNADERFFVNQHYFDFLARVPDQSGFDFWAGQITQCGSDQTCIKNKRLDVSNAFFFELEYQQTAANVYRLYRAAYGNNQPFPNPDTSNPTEANKIPSYAVFSQDRGRLIGSANLAQDQLALANDFVTRPEFLTKYPANLTLDQFVDAVLLTIKTDEGADLTSQRTALIALGSRGAVMYRLADDNQTNPINNQAFIDAAYNRSFVASQYFGYLRRDPDVGGFLFWLGQVNAAPLRDVARQHAMVCSFTTSLEYQLRFSSVTPHSNLECPQ